MVDRYGLDICFMPMVVDTCLSKAIFRLSVCEPGVFGQLFSPGLAPASAVARRLPPPAHSLYEGAGLQWSCPARYRFS